MHHIARMIGRLVAGSVGLGVALFLGGQVAFAAPPPMGGMNNIMVNQNITQNANGSAIANAMNSGRRGSAFAFANFSPVQIASQNSVVNASNGRVRRMGPGGMNNIMVNQNITQNANGSAIANAMNSGRRGSAFRL
jgi:hypothetical protein